MSLRGVRAHDSRTLTSALHGQLRIDPAARAGILRPDPRPLSQSSADPEREAASMNSSDTFVVVGAGLAGAKAAEALREQGFDRPHRADRRRAAPALRTATAVEGLPERLVGAGEGLRASAELVRRAGRRAAPGPDGHRASTATRSRCELADGDQLRYDKLLLATGASPRSLPVPGADADGRLPAAHPGRLGRAARAVRRHPAAGGDRRRLDRPGGHRRRPAGRRRGHRGGERASCRCCGSSGPRWPRCSPTCTPATGWISVSTQA